MMRAGVNAFVAFHPEFVTEVMERFQEVVAL